MIRTRTSKLRAGFSLIEVTVAAAVFSIVGYTLVGALEMGQDSQELVIQGAAANKELRESSTTFVEELGMCQSASMVVTTLWDGNCEVDFMLPIEVAGVSTWGVDDETLGANEGWRVRYTVMLGQEEQRQLVRQILDDAGIAQDSQVIVDDVRSGTDSKPGFSITQAGAVWQVSIATESHDAALQGEEVEFDVLTKN